MLGMMEMGVAMDDSKHTENCKFGLAHFRGAPLFKPEESVVTQLTALQCVGTSAPILTVAGYYRTDFGIKIPFRQVVI
jgi:hypothetical protein